MSNDGDNSDQTPAWEENTGGEEQTSFSGAEASGVGHSSPAEETQPHDTVVEDYEKNVAQLFSEGKKNKGSASDANRAEGQTVEEGTKVQETAQEVPTEGKGHDLESGEKATKASFTLSQYWPLTGDQTKWAALGLLTLIVVFLFAIAVGQRTGLRKDKKFDNSVVDIIEDEKPSANIFHQAPLTPSPQVLPMDQRPVVNFSPGHLAMLGGVAEVGGGVLSLDSIKEKVLKFAPLMFPLVMILSSMGLGTQLSNLGMFNIYFVVGGAIGLYLVKSRWPRGPEDEGAKSYLYFILWRVLWVVVGVSLVGMILSGFAHMLPAGIGDKGLALAQTYFPVATNFFITLWQERVVPIFVF